MRRLAVMAFFGILPALGAPAQATGQETSTLLSVGEMAPDIQLAGATRHGVLSETVRLSDFRGETVVLAFFYRARSGG
jgi:peroxiredoxin Q/BCP